MKKELINLIKTIAGGPAYFVFAIMIIIFVVESGTGQSPKTRSSGTSFDTSDAALVKLLPGFENGYKQVNGTRLHYVTGGQGMPLILLPGWPETWWEFNKVMPSLARQFRVIAVDLRGMGGSDKPPAGYDKKTMAQDVYELARQLGFEKVNIAGHDIGSMVAFSFAANHPEATLKLALLDVPHPDEFFSELRMLPEQGKFGEKIDDEHPGYPWWFAFHQVKGLPEKLLAGGGGGDGLKIYINWLMDYLLKDSKAINSHSRAVYEAAYKSADAIRAGDAWYQTFPRDIIDGRTYKKLEMPVLGLGATGYGWLQAAVTPKATKFRLVKIENSGHFMQEEQPEVVSGLLIEFFK